MSTHDQTNGGSNSDSSGNLSDRVAIVALVVSLGALAVTLLQVLQQYLASAADAHRRCTPSVMGLWGNKTTRRFRRSELRFEVLFETPVILTMPPGSKICPIPNKEVFEITGTLESYKNSNTRSPEDRTVTNVHTADDERASWVTLLEQLQKVEHDSAVYESRYRISPRGTTYPEAQHSFVVSLQKKTRSYDFVPSNVMKPVAATTLGHLVEMAAHLGMFWKDFDMDNDRLRAEGNGYAFSSAFFPGFGLVIEFSIIGASRFEAARVIPCIQLKELVFGNVPCILDEPLNLTDSKHVDETLRKYWFSDFDIHAFHRAHNRPYMFDLTFELIALVANPFRIRNSNFKMLPNPCNHYWRPRINFLLCMRAFHDRLTTLLEPMAIANRHPLLSLINMQFNLYFTPSLLAAEVVDIDVREAAHNGLDQTAEFLISSIGGVMVRRVVGAHLSSVLASYDELERSVTERGASPEINLLKYYFNEIRPIVARGDLGTDYSAFYNTSTGGGVQSGVGSGPGSMITDAQREERTAVWVALVFRMWCWLLLHEFDEEDRCIMPVAFKGSRLQVFIG